MMILKKSKDTCGFAGFLPGVNLILSGITVNLSQYVHSALFESCGASPLSEGFGIIFGNYIALMSPSKDEMLNHFFCRST